MESPTPAQILTESAVFWSIGLVLFLGRLWSRSIVTKSWRKLKLDDYMMVGTFGAYTGLLVLLQFSSRYATNELPPSQIPAVLADPKQVESRIFGSKIVIGSNQCYLLTLWGVKGCLLTLYYHMTRDTYFRLHKFVKFVICYVIFGLVAIEVPYFFILCRPFSQYWAMPVENPQCANYFYYCIIQMVFNVSSDALMLVIPIPFILKASLPPLKRAVLLCIFSLGTFVILAAVLNKYYNFSRPNITIYMLWDIRETSTAIYVSNIICLWPLLRKFFGWSAFNRVSSIGRRQHDVEGSGSSSSSPSQGFFNSKFKSLHRTTPSIDQYGEDTDSYQEMRSERIPSVATMLRL